MSLSFWALGNSKIQPMRFSKSSCWFIVTVLLFSVLASQAGAQGTTLRGEDARATIHDQVRSLPEKASSLFYYGNEGVDLDLSLSFSCSNTERQAILDELIARYHLKAHAARLPEDLRRLDMPPTSLLQLNDWRHSDAKTEAFHEADTVLLFVDPDRSRVFFRRWST